MSDSTSKNTISVIPIHRHSKAILDVATHLNTIKIGHGTKLEVFTFGMNSNEFDYDNIATALTESVYEFALSRSTIRRYNKEGLHGTLFKEAARRFIKYKRNKNSEKDGELGELLLFCFLEGHLGAPKILSKLESKTSENVPIFKADGIHCLKLDNGNFQLVFGESKLYEDPTQGLREAFNSIAALKQEGISFERSILSNSIEKEALESNERELLKKIIYPTEREELFNVDHSFGIFLGYDMDISQQRSLPNNEFRDYVKNRAMSMMKQRVKLVEKYIKNHSLEGYSFYIYTVPFSNIGENRITLKERLVGLI